MKRVGTQAFGATAYFWWWAEELGLREDHIEQIQKDVLVRLAERFPLGGDTILYDATNFFTYIDTFNERTHLAQRGNLTGPGQWG